MTQRSCGEALVELLETFGIDTVFGIPGVHTVELYRGLPETRIRHITPRHEQGAGFMADGYARAGGRPAACFIITGPGMTNITTAMGQAYGDSVPMLVISSVNATKDLGLGEGRLHELPSQQKLISGVTAFSHTLTRPEDLTGVLERAFARFEAARPRPVHIELPLDVITSKATGLTLKTRPRFEKPSPDETQIVRAASLLRKAERPLVVLGGGAQDAAEEARELVKRLGVPAVTTINGKGILAPEDPLNLGSTLPQPPVLEALTHADVALAVGTELGETDTLLFRRRLEIRGKLVRLDIDPEQLNRNAKAEVGIVSDAKAALKALADALPATGGSRRTETARAAAMREALDALLTDVQRVHQRVMGALDAALPGAIIVGDSTQLIYNANLFYQPKSPRSYFNSSTGYGTLGYALPASLGAKLATPGRPVVAIIGDGGLMFTVGELATAVELKLPVAILVWNNRGYGEIKRHMAERGIPQIGVDIYTPDLLAVAAAFGCHTARADTLDQLKELLAETPNASGPTVIEVEEETALKW